MSLRFFGNNLRKQNTLDVSPIRDKGECRASILFRRSDIRFLSVEIRPSQIHQKLRFSP